MSLQQLVTDIENRISKIYDEISDSDEVAMGFRERRARVLNEGLSDVDEIVRTKIMNEFDGWGPLTALIERKELTEILLNGPDSLWFESQGRLHAAEDRYFSFTNYQRMLERLCLEAGTHLSSERPSADGSWRDFRIHVTGTPVSGEYPIVSLRRHPENPWNLEKLTQAGWCSDGDAQLLTTLIRRRWNFLVIGPTSAGKTSVVNALLAQSSPDRSAILEDCREIHVPAGPSIRLLTRNDAQGILPEITLTDLLRQSLRLRPDRIVVGEIRGGEAKDYLLALSTGHAGSFGTIHADNASQALLRLEMLVQMGAPEWSLETIRRLIRLSLNAIVLCGKNERGERRFKGLHRIVSLEESGFLIEPVESIP